MPIQKTTKGDIIKKSIQVFRKKGYYRTSMADLAEASELTKGAFYYHFTNKEDVMLKSLQATRQWFDKKIFSIAYKDELSGKQRLKNMSDVLFKAFTIEIGGCFFANTILETAHIEDTFKHDLKEFFNDWENALIHILKSKYMNKEAKEFASQIMADIEGSIILMQLFDDKKYLKKAIERGSKLV